MLCVLKQKLTTWPFSFGFLLFNRQLLLSEYAYCVAKGFTNIPKTDTKNIHNNNLWMSKCCPVWNLNP